MRTNSAIGRSLEAVETRNRIVNEALALPNEHRKAIAMTLLCTLDELVDDDFSAEVEINRLAGQESDRRIARYDAGLEDAIPVEEVFRRTRERTRK